MKERCTLSIINLREKIVLDLEFLQVKANDLKKVRVFSLSSILLHFLEGLLLFIKDRQSVRETLDWDRLQTLLVILSFKHITSLTLLQFSHLKLIAKNENKKQTNYLFKEGGWSCFPTSSFFPRYAERFLMLFKK